MNNSDNLWGSAFGLIVCVFIVKIFFKDMGLLGYAAVIGAGLVGGYWIQQLIQQIIGKK